MEDTSKALIRPATSDDATDLAKLIDIAGEGIPSWLWSQDATGDQLPLDVGAARAQRTSGGFSYRNAFVAEQDGQVVGMVLAYPIDTAPQDDPDDLPPPIAPFVALEAKSVGTWFINALAVYAQTRGNGIGTALLAEAEARATKAGYPALSIQVYGQNAGAVLLYQRLGFRVIGHTPVRQHPCQPYYTGDVLALLKSIEDCDVA